MAAEGMAMSGNMESGRERLEAPSRDLNQHLQWLDDLVTQAQRGEKSAAQQLERLKHWENSVTFTNAYGTEEKLLELMEEGADKPEHPRHQEYQRAEAFWSKFVQVRRSLEQMPKDAVEVKLAESPAREGGGANGPVKRKKSGRGKERRRGLEKEGKTEITSQERTDEPGPEDAREPVRVGTNLGERLAAATRTRGHKVSRSSSQTESHALGYSGNPGARADNPGGNLGREDRDPLVEKLTQQPTFYPAKGHMTMTDEERKQAAKKYEERLAQARKELEGLTDEEIGEWAERAFGPHQKQKKEQGVKSEGREEKGRSRKAPRIEAVSHERAQVFLEVINAALKNPEESDPREVQDAFHALETYFLSRAQHETDPLEKEAWLHHYDLLWEPIARYKQTLREGALRVILAKKGKSLDRAGLEKIVGFMGLDTDDLAGLDDAGPRRSLESGKVEDGKEKRRQIGAYRFWAEQFMRGMTIADMHVILKRQERPLFIPSELKREDLLQALRLFSEDLETERNPLRKFAREVSEKQGFANFVYEAKLDRRTGAPGKGERAMDMDVKLALWLLKRTGVVEAAQAKPIRQGEVVSGAFHIDTGGKSGAFLDESKVATDGRAAAGVDNHPRHREYPTSTAKILYNLLRKQNAITEKFPYFAELRGKDTPEAQAEKRVIEMMIQYSVDEDNASFPARRGQLLDDFKRSHTTLFGLGRYLSAEQLYDYFKRYAGEGRFREAYRKTVMDREFADEDLERYGLTEKMRQHRSLGSQTEAPRKARITLPEYTLACIEQARSRLEKPREQLYAEGRIINTRFGTYMVDIIQNPEDKTMAGYNAAKAYGLDGVVSYNVSEQSFLINTLREDVDLSQDKILMALAEKSGAVSVRGTMIIKTPDGTPVSVSLKEILGATTHSDFSPQGRVKEALALEAEGKLKPAEKPAASRVAEPKAEAPKVEKEKFGGNLETLDVIAKNNLTKFRDWLLQAYQIDEATLKEAVGPHFWALVNGDAAEYKKLVESGEKRGGDEEVLKEIMEKNIPYLKKWLLVNYEISDEKLREAFGQAYNDLGFDKTPEINASQEERLEILKHINGILKKYQGPKYSPEWEEMWERKQIIPVHPVEDPELERGVFARADFKPKFRESQSSTVLLIPGLRADEFYLVPHPTITDYFVPSIMINYDIGGVKSRYDEVEIVEPAMVKKIGDEWELVKKGILKSTKKSPELSDKGETK